MKKNIGLWIGIGVVVILALFLIGSYNGLVGVDTTVEQKWGNVQSAYQRRADLIPNLVDTVKGARDFEQSTLTEITQLRSEAGQAQVNVQNAQDADSLQQAGTDMSSVVSRLLVIVENYPDLKSNENFLALQDELAGTENLIKYERDQYNEAVKGYKQNVRMFPTNMVAGMFGFSADKWNTF